jgi:hypothetical protein
VSSFIPKLKLSNVAAFTLYFATFTTTYQLPPCGDQDPDVLRAKSALTMEMREATQNVLKTLRRMYN